MTKFSIYVSLILGLTVSCKEFKREGIYEHGRMEYKITYLNENNGNFDPSFLPKKMILEFNSQFCTNTIDGFMGLFRLGNITYFKKKKSITHLKVLDKNYLFVGNRHELMCCFELFEDMVIKPDTNTKMIAGLLSQHAKAYVPKLQETFDIYYTYDIALDHPNITNPYDDIDGVLTDFVLYMGPYKMRFEAQKFDPVKNPVEDSKYIPDSSTHTVSREEMVYALDRLMKQ
jgi:hypothetical protein